MKNVQTEPDYIAGIDRQLANSPKDHIPGWGIDADPENDPTYPMKHWNGADHDRLNYVKAPQQPVKQEVFHSNERPGITRVFGTSSPPRGLSGKIRRHAYKYSEATTAHWMTLLLADRVDVFEGIISDLKSGHIPNIPKERGWAAEWKVNKEGVVKKVVYGVVATAVLISLFSSKKK
jgi:hypothetical protein